MAWKFTTEKFTKDQNDLEVSNNDLISFSKQTSLAYNYSTAVTSAMPSKAQSLRS